MAMEGEPTMVRTHVGNVGRRMAAGILLAVMAVGPASAAQPYLMHFAADGNLDVRDGAGRTVQAGGGKATDFRFVDGRRGRGVYIPVRRTLVLPIDKLDPTEGTLSFWFRPDWSPNTRTPFMMFELHADPAYRIRFRRGFTAPDHCYLQVGDRYPCAFGSFSLFTAKTWRHYALRWSAARGRIQFVVDGEARGESGRRRMGRFACDVVGPVKATLRLHGWSRGAFDEVKVFGRYLSVADLVREAGLTRVARYLQEQAPPPGGGSSVEAAQAV